MMGKILLFMGGFITLVIGMTLVLRNWTEVYIVFQGISSPAVAVAGLVMMFAVTLKNKP